MDTSLTFVLNQFAGQSQLLNNAVVFCAEYFPYVVVALFVVFVCMWGKHPLSFSPSKEGERIKLFVEGIGAALIARGCVEVIRFFIHRPRPFVNNETIVALLSETSYSFPSGHAAFFFALSTTVYLHNKRLGIWFFIASAVIGIARVMVGVHYPTDILGGAVLGVIVGWGVRRYFFKRNITTPPLAPLLN